MIMYLSGNSSVEFDALPARLAATLRRHFPLAEVYRIDPTEHFVPEGESIIIDRVMGLTHIEWLSDLSGFAGSPRVSVHDYDLFVHLSLLKKLGKITEWLLLGIPAEDHSSGLTDRIIRQIRKRFPAI